MVAQRATGRHRTYKCIRNGDFEPLSVAYFEPWVGRHHSSHDADHVRVDCERAAISWATTIVLGWQEYKYKCYKTNAPETIHHNHYYGYQCGNIGSKILAPVLAPYTSQGPKLEAHTLNWMYDYNIYYCVTYCLSPPLSWSMTSW